MSFAAPAVLLALIAVPAIWWLLRLTPPRPRAETFPPTRLLAELARKEETPAQTPWWLTALRLLLATIVILALAGPILRPTAEVAPGEGPLLVVLDNGWASAARFDAMQSTALSIVRLAEDADRPVAFIATAEDAGQIMPPSAATEVAARIAALQPRPFAADYGAVLPAVTDLTAGSGFGGAVWLSDGLGGEGQTNLATLLAAAVSGPVVVYDDRDAIVLGLTEAQSTAAALTVPVIRQPTGLSTEGVVIARDLRGRVIGEAPFAFPPDAIEATAAFTLPTELRNEIVRLEIGGETTAGAVQLLDDRYRRRTVGIVSGEAMEQPLLSAEYYIVRALQPFADIRPTTGDLGPAISGLIDSGVSAIILADVGTLPQQDEERLAAWVAAGGTLIRFAGPRVATSERTTLIPVALRQGGRTLGGALSWETPQPLGEFPRTSPFFGFAVPGDVLVERQVLAEPDAGLAEKTWAVLADGTPLVTGARSGDGLLVLFHVTGDTSWSNLPLSGVFVEMLSEIMTMSAASVVVQAAGAEATLAPYLTLDGLGRLGEPGPTVEPLVIGPDPVAIDAAHPPGLYGTEQAFRSVNLLAAGATLDRPDWSPLASNAVRLYPDAAPIELQPWLLAAALILLILDATAVLALGGAFAPRKATPATLALLAIVAAPLLLGPGTREAEAQALTPADEMALAAANRTSLAYVITGNAQSDDISRAGLFGLSTVLTQRTSFEPGPAFGVDIATDELVFFPLLYWRIDPSAPMPSPEAIARIDTYMRNGGTVLFDTADQLQQTTLALNPATVTPATQRLRDILATLDIPPIEPVPADHVLTKSFFLLNDFPGRHIGGQLWVEALAPADPNLVDRPVRPSDTVSPIIITSNDFAAAWAIDDTGAFLFPTDNADRQQREYAFRSGINIVMYTLTGNYKTDQVHVPAILERLGQ